MEEYTRKTIEFYEDNSEDYINNTESLQDTEWIDKFMSKLPKEGRVLDLGCAFGRDVEKFVDNGFETHGVDLSEKFISIAKKKVPGGKFIIADALNIPFERNFFDGVWCSATLHHIAKKDFAKSLIQIRKSLKAGGILYLHLKKGDGEKFVEDKRYSGAKKFYSYFQRKEIIEYLRSADFSIEEFDLVFDEKEKYRDTGLFYIIARK